MRFKILYILLSLTMGLAVTGSAATGPRPSEGEAGRSRLPYTERRWIGLLQKGLSACPPVAGWRAEPLFPAKTEKKDRDLYQKYDLDRLCAYTQEDASKPFPRPIPRGLEKAERDRMALVPSGAILVGSESWKADHFLAQVGKVRLVRTVKPGVRLVFVDTYPTTDQFSDVFPVLNSWHGYAMARFSKNLVCSNDNQPQSCAIHIATRLALRYRSFDPNMSFSPDPAGDNSGDMGRISDLAVAILTEIRHWQETEPQTKLILNLSVGWDGELPGAGGTSDLDARQVSELEPSVQAVYNALRYAAHRGVLVIAAAGDRQRGPQGSQWPLLPAAWELHRPSQDPFPVYAVGGIDWHRAVVKTGNAPLEPLMPHLRTPVSEAAASAIAAVVWHLRPGLGPAEVMRLIGRSGEVPESRADFYAWNLAPDSRPISLCRTVLRICGADEGLCPGLKAIHCEICEHSAELEDLKPEKLCPYPDKILRAPGLIPQGPPKNPCPSCNIIPDPPR